MLYNTENLHGGDTIYKDRIILDYSVNINPYGTPEEVRSAMEESLKQIHNYPDPYCRDLIKAIAEYENVPEEYILCGSGAAELIYSYAAAAGISWAAEIAPAFSEYAKGVKAADKEAVIDRFYAEKNKDFLPGNEFLDFLEKTDADALFLCNPNNPTGRVIPEELLVKILNMCRKKNIRLFVDECFLDMADEGISLKKYLNEYKGLFILKAFTKNFGMAGVRLGYALTSDSDLLKKMSGLSQPWNISIPAQAAGTEAVKHPEFIEKAGRIISTERKRMLRELSDIMEYVCPSEANFILFKGPSDLGDKMRAKGISIRDCSNFEGLCRGWYRTAVKLPKENTVLIETMRTVIGE